MTAPFDQAEAYRAKGWSGEIALPARAKDPPPDGFTGYEGRFSTPTDWARWRQSGLTNIALRLPPNVVGLDVDAYGGKRGAETLATREAEWGALPPTYVSTSRGVSASGIRLFRLPPGAPTGAENGWPTEAGPGIEIIRFAHRYAVVWPSVHPEGRIYRWRRPDGGDAGELPGLGDLAELPEAWVAGLTGHSNGQSGQKPGSRASRREDDKQARQWINDLPKGKSCRYAGKLAADALAAARREDGNAYDHTMAAVLALLRAGETGHTGIAGILARVRAAYIETVKDRASAGEAEREFDRFTFGGVAKVLATPGPAPDTMSGAPGCDCEPGLGATPNVPLFWSTARELADRTPEEPAWLIDGLLALNVVTELSAKIKVGKTTFWAAAVSAMLLGEPFLGLATRQCAVVLLTEEREATLRDLLKRTGLDAADNLFILHRYATRAYEWADIVAEAVRKAGSVGAGLLVVDTLPDWAGIAGDAENNSGDALTAMRPLQDAAAAGLGVLSVRHDRKGGGEIGDSARGSSAYGGAADILLQLTKTTTAGHENRRTLTGVGRFDRVPGAIVIEFVDGVFRALGSSADVERTEVRARVLDILPDAGARMLSETDLLERLGDAKRSTLKRVLDGLVEEGRVAKATGAGKTGRAFGYALNELSSIGKYPGQLSSDYAFDLGVPNELSTGGAPGQLSSTAPPAQLSSPLPLSGQFGPTVEDLCQAPPFGEWCPVDRCIQVVSATRRCPQHGAAGAVSGHPPGPLARGKAAQG